MRGIRCVEVPVGLLEIWRDQLRICGDRAQSAGNLLREAPYHGDPWAIEVRADALSLRDAIKGVVDGIDLYIEGGD